MAKRIDFHSANEASQITEAGTTKLVRVTRASVRNAVGSRSYAVWALLLTHSTDGEICKSITYFRRNLPRVFGRHRVGRMNIATTLTASRAAKYLVAVDAVGLSEILVLGTSEKSPTRRRVHGLLSGRHAWVPETFAVRFGLRGAKGPKSVGTEPPQPPP